MSFKKIKHNSGDSIVQIKIIDETGARIENWTIMMKDLFKWTKTICRKYEIDMPKKEGLIDKKDLDWAI